ncbi:unnamed protein product, partial [Lymnaea stagnalis]
VSPADSIFNFVDENVSRIPCQNMEPIFIDEFNPADLSRAVEFCGNQNDACIFDYMLTGDETFAQNTRDSQNEMEAIMQSLNNTSSTLELIIWSGFSNNRWVVYELITITIQVVARDEDGDDVMYELVGDSNQTTVSQNGTVTYFPSLQSLPVLG